MPCAEQPPLELLRQAIGQGGWYGRDAAFRALADVQFVAAMGPPGGSRTAVTDRLLRHFHCLALSQVLSSRSFPSSATLPCRKRGGTGQLDMHTLFSVTSLST